MEKERADNYFMNVGSTDINQHSKIVRFGLGIKSQEFYTIITSIEEF